jgi:L-seryl-tRNA(Ser) seleniumtransferase
VINAQGVVLHTNLGRALLSPLALERLQAVATAYSNLELDLVRKERGSRYSHVEAVLRRLTRAEDALVVNNNAAAVLLGLETLAHGREVIVSRGELVEIGGGFRVPDVMRQGGARLVEVGTTNRTRVADYAAAIGPETGALLAVHPSNFRVVGFTETAPRSALADLAHAHTLPLIEDLGSGCLLATERWGLAHEPTPMESLAAGADVVCFSGDKLLGGPQAGIIVGRAAALAPLARHPLLRAMRIDKLTLAALEATLRHYRDGTAERDVPVWRMIAAPLAGLRERAERWAARLGEAGAQASTQPGESTVGGGSLPGETLPTVLCAVEAPGADAEIASLAARLRRGAPPVVARVSRGRLLLDPRTVVPEQDEALLGAAIAALRGR